MRQGYIGNCWFLAGAAAVAEVPDRLEKIFLNPSNRLSPNGIYGINIWTLGVKHSVIVDDWLPVQTWGNGYNTLFAHVGPDQALWMSILEKAFSKYHGNYEHIEAGNPTSSSALAKALPVSFVTLVALAAFDGTEDAQRFPCRPSDGAKFITLRKP